MDYSVVRFNGLLGLGVARSICSKDNLQALTNMIHQTKNVLGDIVEIGSYQCGSTIVMAATAEHITKPIKQVFAFDTFSAMPAVSEFDEHKAGNFGDMDFEEISKAVSVLPNITLVRGIHEETIPAFAPRQLAFVFMDSDLYVSHLVALQNLWPMISKGGVIMFHDSKTDDCPGVRKAIAEFFGDMVIHQTTVSDMLAIQK